MKKSPEGWDELFASKSTVSIKKKVDDKVLFMPLFELQDELLAKEYDSDNALISIRKIIQKYLDSDQSLTLK